MGSDEIEDMKAVCLLFIDFNLNGIMFGITFKRDMEQNINLYMFHFECPTDTI